jgi:hypothetical protein
MNDAERDQIIIETHTDVQYLKEKIDGHLEHHFKYSFYAWTALVGVIITLAIMLLN